jgi:putative heme-binding domain-containing protein
VNRWALVGVAALFATAAAVQAQRANPLEASPDAVRAGASLFAARCADCHGPDAKGNRGPDLTTLWQRGATDERVFATIRSGVAGTIMPPSAAPDTEVWAIVAHLRNVSTVPALATSGDAMRGRELFAAGCAGCHRAGPVGAGGIGPDLTKIVLARSREALVESVRKPNAVVAEGFRSVTLRPRGGEAFKGVLKREDAFSLQVVTEDGRLRAYAAAGLVDIARSLDSPMPEFGPDRLSDAALEDLLAFLAAAARTPASALLSTARSAP